MTISTPEEKGSDVNLASRLLIDAFTGQFEQAIVMSLDTDLVLPIGYVTRRLQLPVGLLVNRDRMTRRGTQRTRVPAELRRASKFQRFYRSSDVRECQLPNPVRTSTGAEIHMPSSW